SVQRPAHPPGSHVVMRSRSPAPAGPGIGHGYPTVTARLPIGRGTGGLVALPGHGAGWDDRSVPVLLERDAELDLLHRAVVAAAGGPDSLRFLRRHAGVPRQHLVQAWLATLPDSTRVLVGSCEDLRTP